MREGRRVAVTSAGTLEPQRHERLVLEAAPEVPPPPTPLPRPSAADRIREALRRWLEEDM